MSLEETTKKTIDLLGRIVKKTPLNHKLLSKPPFRYLHDLCGEVIRESGSFVGLYSEMELKHENYKVIWGFIKDKDSKVQYLTKMIQCLRLYVINLEYATGVKLKANPLKIVAGMEPIDTNVMIQVLGKVVLKKVDTSEAIRKVTGSNVKSASHAEEEETVPEPVPEPVSRPKTSNLNNGTTAKQDGFESKEQ
jgi:TRAF3-interacting protein 1